MRICKWIAGLFALAYVAALAILAIGTFGLFGQERDPLSGVFVLLLGWPWTRLLDGLAEPVRPLAAAAMPMMNLAALWLACGLARRARG
jgi:hypothetical protein